MGSIWLLDLPDACRAAGLHVELFDGWETRSRSSGGYDDLLGVGYHHDASSPSSSDGNSDNYGWVNAEDKPIGAMRLHRDGVLVIGAAGATNTMGKGAPLTCSGGTVPLDRGNQTLIAIEAANNGVGEPWPKVQLDAYIALVGGLCAWYGFDPHRDIFSHAEYCEPTCPGRKIDPAGPTPSRPAIGGTSGAATWSTPGFRDAVAAWTPPIPPDDELTEAEVQEILDAIAALQKDVDGLVTNSANRYADLEAKINRNRDHTDSLATNESNRYKQYVTWHDDVMDAVTDGEAEATAALADVEPPP